MNQHIQVGDRIEIIKDRVGNKLLANVELGEILTITGISDDGKILYHNGSLALPAASDIYRKLSSFTENKNS